MQPTRRTTLLHTLLLWAFFALLIAQPAHALEIVLRHSIGPDGTLTDGRPGASTIASGGTTWASPGMVVDLSGIVDGKLNEVKIA